jgi:hypothetical protein
MKEFLAISALTVSIGANIPYAIDIIKGKAKPERVSIRIIPDEFRVAHSYSQ